MRWIFFEMTALGSGFEHIAIGMFLLLFGLGQYHSCTCTTFPHPDCMLIINCNKNIISVITLVAIANSEQEAMSKACPAPGRQN
jgi:hypothetical protein